MTGADIAPLVAVLGAVVLINLAFAWLFARSDRGLAGLLGSQRDAPADESAPAAPAAPPIPTGDPPPLDADGETVVCRHCGAENRTGYHYCRWCVRSGFVDEGAGGTAGAAMSNRPL